MKRYELILFDFDGTLVDTIADIAHYANLTLKRYGHRERSRKEIQEAVGWGVHELLKKLEPDFSLDEKRLEDAVTFFKSGYQEKPVVTAGAYESVREMLGGPLSRIKKAIVTNKPQDITMKILKELALEHHFEIVVGINAGFPPKPDPAGVRHILEKLSVSAEKTLFIGDSGDVDGQTSRNAGVDFGWVDYGYHGIHEHKPLMVFSSAAEWAKIAV